MKFASLKYSLVLALSVSAGCAERAVAPAETQNHIASGTEAVRIDRGDEDNLTQVFAYARKQQVAKVDYAVAFQFVKNSETYKAVTVMNVTLRLLDRPLSIDASAKSVDHILINGNEIKDFVVKEGSIDIPARDLRTQSKIEIQTVQVYSKTGDGIQSSIDPVDKAEYIYTDLEPYGAHRVFPCLDQPDLKATFQFTINAPSDWRALSNTIAEKSVVNGGVTTTTFAVTQPISTYLTFVGVGPFVEITDKVGDTAITVNTRASLSRYLDSKLAIDVSKKGLAFYATYFGTPYPFSKFGLVFAPDFTEGGMENPGNIVLSERFIRRGAMTPSQQANFRDVILHEMAHMWFGDLVTMKWWNDLWLNESFASYMSAVAQEKAIGDTSAWVRFQGEKTWGYWQDQLVTSHPIEAPIPDIRSARGNFDGITYGKGAAVLKQLHYFVGDAGFKSGLANYFKKFSYSNSERKDFVSELSTAANQPLGKWTQSWLQSAGPNRITLNWSCSAGGKINKFELDQQANVGGELSPHRTKIGLFKDGKMYKEQETSYDLAATSIDALIGADCPDFVNGNSGDEDYALYAIDPVSMKAVKVGLTGQFTDPLLRAQVWQGLGQMVYDLKISTGDFFAIAIPALQTEKDLGVLTRMIGSHGFIADVYFHELSPAQRKQLAPKLEAALWNRRSEIEFFDAYSEFATTSPAQLNLKMFLDDANVPKGIKLDQDRRWAMLKTMAFDNYPGVKGLIASERKRDSSSEGKLNADTALLAIPELAGKKKFFAELLDAQKIPMAVLNEESGAFHSVDHPELSEVFVQDFFSRVKNMDWAANDSLIGVYFRNVFPEVICSDELLKKSQQSLGEALNLTAHAKRAWLEANDELAKCVAIRNRSK